MRIWIDLANSPHPILFAPIAQALEEADHEILVTVRDHAQTVALAGQRWSRVTIVGGQSPSGRIPKLRSIARRARELARFAREARADVAVSHNSYAQAIGARMAGVRFITAMDYEHQPANHLAFRLAHRVLVPNVFPAGSLRRQGAKPKETWRYTGFKEEVYLHGFRSNPEVAERLGLKEGETYVLARPGPTGAIYHRFGNPIFAQAIERLLETTHTQIVLLPRRAADIEELSGLPTGYRKRLLVPDRAVDALSLTAGAAALVGAGGTMNREAALLGTPVFSLFGGRLGAIDRLLIEQRRMVHLSGEPAIENLIAAVSEASGSRRCETPGPAVLKRFVEAIVTPL